MRVPPDIDSKKPAGKDLALLLLERPLSLEGCGISQIRLTKNDDKTKSKQKANKTQTKADKRTFSAETECRVYQWVKNGFEKFILSTVPVTLISPTKCKLKTF